MRLTSLLAYSDHERGKWKAWLAADPARLQIPFQPDGRFPTIGAVFDHVFLVERRHLSRLEGATPPDASGVTPGDVDALFEYADLVRADFRKYIADLDEVSAQQALTVTVQSGPRTMSRRHLSLHILLHEVRHLAQIALAARVGRDAPPGDHDYFYFDESVE